MGAAGEEDEEEAEEEEDEDEDAPKKPKKEKKPDKALAMCSVDCKRPEALSKTGVILLKLYRDYRGAGARSGPPRRACVRAEQARARVCVCAALVQPLTTSNRVAWPGWLGVKFISFSLSEFEPGHE